jgi:hypothetical protein
MCDRAAVTLTRALNGDVTPGEARAAFEDAAREADIIVDTKRFRAPRD